MTSSSKVFVQIIDYLDLLRNSEKDNLNMLVSDKDMVVVLDVLLTYHKASAIGEIARAHV